ncbi:MAG: hypothetical protein BJ554DRAFT_6859 [Olpidium bornovanus]|uniref:Glutaredoxin domain-containing protein n=1 Tax=Olpidium bornovanus TaxID=278681 RepID=A0A8H8DM85_9FUNG|nr:MAG: hypothetical protein BJ554DRAFT_6859 [Olpidium bornovanus]
MAGGARQPVAVRSEDHYAQLVAAVPADRVLLLNFWADWAQPSVNMNLVVGDLAERYPGVTFLNRLVAPGELALRRVPSRPLLLSHHAGRRSASGLAGWRGSPVGRDSVSHAAVAPAPVRFRLSLFCQIDAEAVPEVSLSFDITAVPTFVVTKGGKELERINGASARELTDAVAKYAKHQAAPPAQTPPPAPSSLPPVNGGPRPANGSATGGAGGADLTARLKLLVGSAPVMLFMKGTPGEPRCGFSKKIVDLLNAQGVRFGSFDILTDDEVRQGLKEYSDWPTYPQLYVKEELVGGLDIVQQLVESGEFKRMVPVKTQFARLMVMEPANEAKADAAKREIADNG